MYICVYMYIDMYVCVCVWDIHIHQINGKLFWEILNNFIRIVCLILTCTLLK